MSAAAWIAACAAAIAMAAVPVLVGMPSDLDAAQATAANLSDALRDARVAHNAPRPLPAEPRP